MRIILTADPELPVPPKFYGGIERIVDLLVKGLHKKGHEVALVAHSESISPASKFFPWRGKRSQSKFDTVQNTIALWSTVREFQPDLVHSFSRIFYMLPILRSPLPKIMSYQRKPSDRTVKLAAKLAGKSLTFTGCSNSICQIGRKAGGNWQTIYNCVEPEQYTFQPNIISDAPLVFLSRIERIKGAHTAIKIAQKSGRQLIIAGNYSKTGESGRYWREEIEPHLGKNGIDYIGTVNDKQKNNLLGQALALLVPIEWEEPFGIVFAEALACGTPIISCPRGALPEIVTEGVDGYLVKNVDEAVNRINQIQQLDRNHCRQKVIDYFSADKIVEQYELLYKNSLRDTQ